MEIKKILSSKSMKFVTLLLTSMLIASASAAVYYSLTMQSTITTAAHDVYFVLGADNATAGVSIYNDGKSATLASLKAYKNMTTSYDNPLKVRNNSTGTNQIRLRPVSPPGNATYFIFINFTLQSSPLRSLNYTAIGASWTIPSTTGWVTLSPSTEYAIVVQTKASTSATSGQKAHIEIAIDVQQ